MTPLAEYYFELPITGNRDLNFDYFDELFVAQYYNDQDLVSEGLRSFYDDMPQISSELRQAIDNTGITVNVSNMDKILYECNLTRHEVTNGIQLIDSEIHGLIRHSGGRKEAAIRESILCAVTYFTELYSTPSNSIFGTFIAA